MMTRHARLLAALALLAAPGCQGGPLAWTLDLGATAGMAPAQGTPRTMAPNVGLVAPVTASKPPATPRPTASAAPTAAPSAAPATPMPEPSFEAPEPDASLPPAATYGDLEPAEQAAVEEAIATDALLAGYLIHDGGVVLYQLAQLQPAPPDWSRRTLAERSTQLILKKGCLDGPGCAAGNRPVRANIEVLQRGELTVGGRTTRFGEIARRQIVLRPEGGKLVLDQVSPLTAETRGGRLDLEPARIHVLPASRQRALGVIQDFQRATPRAQELQLQAGQPFIVEVEFPGSFRGRPYVYASRAEVGAPRTRLLDDGRADDREAGNQTYSGRFTAAATPGLHHVKIEVLGADAFAEDRPFRAFSVAIAYRVP